jgi:hypothetical protein
MSAATDKEESSAHLDTGRQTAVGIGMPKNIIAQVEVRWPGQTPDKHKLFWIVGQTVPDNTDYPDTIAPIGSRYTRLIVTSGAIAGALEYVKTAAATWTAQS